MPFEKKAEKKNDVVGKSPEEIEEDLQRRSMQFRILQANMQIIHERRRALSMRLREFEETKQTISDMKGVKSGSEVLMPIGSGNFVSGKVSDAEKVLVGVGGGIAIKKSPEDALKFLDERAAEAKSAMQELGMQFAQMESELRMLQSEAGK
ncbi:MAG: prefoldin subunit alpha [Nanoarchaeota archaeon]|nr:prefoldin subunit alpha [Nanoarchaeota archaeon]